MKKLLYAMSSALPTILLVLGAAAVSVGVGLLCVPAGIITAGAAAMAGGVLLIKGGGESDG